MEQLNEGKTKIIYKLSDTEVLVKSKDKITANNAEKKDDIAGKAELSNMTNALVFQYLTRAGIKTHFIRKETETSFVALRCEMIPLEWIARRVATGSFLKRHPGVKEGYRFTPPKIEISFKDDEQGDPIWTEEMVVENKLVVGGLLIDENVVAKLTHATRTVFEMLERAWSVQGCTLVDMKIEFGVHNRPGSGPEIVLADVIDSDSWRLWPAGDKRLQLDKQYYRDLKNVTPEDLQQLKKNYKVAADMLQKFDSDPAGRAVILMGSSGDMAHCQKIKDALAKFAIPATMHVTSAHKGTVDTLRVAKKYEADGIPTVFICVAGRSNGLGPVMAGNTALPVVNCPPVTADWGAQDVWSSLRLPSGLGCTFAMTPEAAGIAAASILGMHDHQVYARLLASKANITMGLIDADAKLQKQLEAPITNGSA